MKSECLEDMLDKIYAKAEDPECGSISEIIDQIKKEEENKRSSLNIEEILICRLDHSMHTMFRNCPQNWIKAGTRFDYFLLIKLRKKKNLCLHVECKSGGKVYTILERLKNKIRGYVYGNECFCFDANPRKVAVVRTESEISGRRKKSLENDIREVGFDYVIIRDGVR